MKLSIIVTVYNRFDYVKNIIKCLKNQTYQPFEVIFTDDGSREDLKKLLKLEKENCDFKIKHIYQKDLGFRKSRACNNAVLEAEGDYLIFLDQDALFPNDLLSTFVKRIKKSYFSIMRVIWTDHNQKEKIQRKFDSGVNYKELIDEIEVDQLKGLKKHLFRDKYNNFRFRLGMRDRGTGLMGIGFGLYKKDYIEINGYDEDFEGWGGEDADLGLRLYLSGLNSITFSTKLPSFHMCHPYDPSKTGDLNKSMYEDKKKEINRDNYRCYFGVDNKKDEDGYSCETI